MFAVNIFNVFFTDLNFTNVSEAKPEKKNQYLMMSELPPRSLSYISERSSRPETRQEWAITQQFKHKHEVWRMKNTQSQSALTRYFCYVSFTWHPIDLYICKIYFVLAAKQKHDTTSDCKTGRTWPGKEVSQGRMGHAFHLHQYQEIERAWSVNSLIWSWIFPIDRINIRYTCTVV